MGLLDDALEVAEKGVATLPHFSPGFAALGWVRAQRGQWGEAGAAFEKALAIDNENLAALKGMAKVQLRNGRREDALKLLQRAAALRPADTGLQKLLAQLEPSAGPSPASLPPAAPLKAQPIATATIAEIYLRQGYLERAAKVYRDILQAEPHNAAIRQKLDAVNRQIELREADGQEPKGEPAAFAPLAAGEKAFAAETRQVFAPAVEKKDGENRVVLELQRWLEAVRKRRDDV